MFQMLQKWNPSKKKIQLIFFFLLCFLCENVKMFFHNSFSPCKTEWKMFLWRIFFLHNLFHFFCHLTYMENKKSLKYVFNLVSHKTSSEKCVFYTSEKKNFFKLSFFSLCFTPEKTKVLLTFSFTFFTQGKQTILFCQIETKHFLHFFLTFSHENVFLHFYLHQKGSDCLQTWI